MSRKPTLEFRSKSPYIPLGGSEKAPGVGGIELGLKGIYFCKEKYTKESFQVKGKQKLKLRGRNRVGKYSRTKLKN